MARNPFNTNRGALKPPTATDVATNTIRTTILAQNAASGATPEQIQAQIDALVSNKAYMTTAVQAAEWQLAKSNALAYPTTYGARTFRSASPEQRAELLKSPQIIASIVPGFFDEPLSGYEDVPDDVLNQIYLELAKKYSAQETTILPQYTEKQWARLNALPDDVRVALVRKIIAGYVVGNWLKLEHLEVPTNYFDKNGNIEYDSDYSGYSWNEEYGFPKGVKGSQIVLTLETLNKILVWLKLPKIVSRGSYKELEVRPADKIGDAAQDVPFIVWRVVMFEQPEGNYLAKDFNTIVNSLIEPLNLEANIKSINPGYSLHISKWNFPKVRYLIEPSGLRSSTVTPAGIIAPERMEHYPKSKGDTTFWKVTNIASQVFAAAVVSYFTAGIAGKMVGAIAGKANMAGSVLADAATKKLTSDLTSGVMSAIQPPPPTVTLPTIMGVDTSAFATQKEEAVDLAQVVDVPIDFRDAPISAAPESFIGQLTDDEKMALYVMGGAVALMLIIIMVR